MAQKPNAAGTIEDDSSNPSGNPPLPVKGESDPAEPLPAVPAESPAYDGTDAKHSPQEEAGAQDEPHHRFSLIRQGKRLFSYLFNTNGYLTLDFFTLFWLFFAGSIIGLAVETVFHMIVYGGWESRAGLVWGPFSPIYGVGAVLLTLFLNRFYHSHNLVVFLIAMVIGSLIEYATSWLMEVAWGAVAWDYTGTFGSIQGRTNFFFGMMWGMLGLVWVRVFLPFVKFVFSHINRKSVVVKVIMVCMVVFMAVNIVCTCLALSRESERKDGIPATNPVQQLCDTWFPDSYLQARFENMTVSGK